MAAPPPRPRRGAGRRFGVSAAALRLIKAACGARPRGAHVSQPPLFWRSRQPCCASPSLEPRLPLALPHPPPLSRPRTSACASAACDRRAAGAMAGLGALWDLILTALEEALFSVYLVVFRVTRGFIALLSPSKVSATHRTVLVVGDGLAEGVGDTLATGGLAPRINTLF
ncbi:hypothetical protein BU14_3156s0001, partial [Porphyra umbilicalis]